MKSKRGMSGWRRSAVAVPLSMFAVILLTINPASASPKSTPTPAVTSWKATPTSLSDNGGSVTFTGKFKYAQTCELSVSPHLTGSPWTTTCTSNTYTKKITIGRNTAGTSRDYTFSFSVKNRTGKTVAPNVVVAQGAAPPPISFTPTVLTFPAQGVAVASNPVSVLVTNNSGSQSQNLEGFSITGPDSPDYFIASGNCGVALSPHQSCDINITFKPQSNGSRTATALIFDSSWGPSGTYASLPIHGTGEFATTSVSTTNLAFGSEGVTVATNFEAITVTNSGSVPLVISGVGIAGGDSNDFLLNTSAAETCQSVPSYTIISVGDTCSVLVQFDPTASGSRSSSLVLTDNTASGTTEIKLSGTGVWATSTLSTYNYTFASTDVGQDLSTTVTITNTSEVGLRFSNPTSYGWTGADEPDFSYEPYTTVDGTMVDCSYSAFILGPGQSCEFTLVFDPVSEGPLSITFELYDNTLNSSSTPGYEQIQLSGTGTP